MAVLTIKTVDDIPLVNTTWNCWLAVVVAYIKLAILKSQPDPRLVNWHCCIVIQVVDTFVWRLKLHADVRDVVIDTLPPNN